MWWWLIGFFIAAVIIVFTLAACKVASDADDQMEKMHITSKPVNTAPLEMSVNVRMWERYNVPLGDDLQRYIYELCEEKGVSMPLVLAIIQKESNFDTDHIGDDGNSFGLMQIYASQHSDRCIRLDAYNLLNPYQNVRVGIDLLSELQGYEKGLEWTLMAYNGGMAYAGQMVADGNVSAYARAVMDIASGLIGTEQTEVK